MMESSVLRSPEMTPSILLVDLKHLSHLQTLGWRVPLAGSLVYFDISGTERTLPSVIGISTCPDTYVYT